MDFRFELFNNGSIYQTNQQPGQSHSEMSWKYRNERAIVNFSVISKLFPKVILGHNLNVLSTAHIMSNLKGFFPFTDQNYDKLNHQFATCLYYGTYGGK